VTKAQEARSVYELSIFDDAVEHPSLAAVLKIAFTTVWNEGMTFEQAYDECVTRREQERLTRP
jgi:hypothetical protein